MEKKLGINLYVAYGRKVYSRDLAVGMSDEDKALIEAFSKQASKETVLAHLMKATIHLRIKGTGKNAGASGEAEAAFLLGDYTMRLFENKVTELNLYLGLDHFIENGDNDFFPSYAKLHKQIFGKAAK
ncbi:hypothetical protein KA005_06215 [bacterium]|nr:hypothetical protein [bacterium]